MNKSKSRRMIDDEDYMHTLKRHENEGKTYILLNNCPGENISPGQSYSQLLTNIGPIFILRSG